MKLVKLGNTDMMVPSVIVGCMRLAGLSKEEMNHFLHTAIENQANFFDHADIYGGGQSESILF